MQIIHIDNVWISQFRKLSHLGHPLRSMPLNKKLPLYIWPIYCAWIIDRTFCAKCILRRHQKYIHCRPRGFIYGTYNQNLTSPFRNANEGLQYRYLDACNSIINDHLTAKKNVLRINKVDICHVTLVWRNFSIWFQCKINVKHTHANNDVDIRCVRSTSACVTGVGKLSVWKVWSYHWITK